MSSGKESAQLHEADASPRGDFKQRVILSIINAFPKCLWPLFGVAALFLFSNPIYGLVESFSRQLSSGASVEIGSVKVALQKKTIPDAPDDVKKILPEMDLDLILFMARNDGGNNTVDTCTPDSFIILNKLVQLNMMSLDKETWHDPQGKDCAGFHYAYKPLYTVTRNYMMKVLSALTFST
jgi:hypothetical protein